MTKDEIILEFMGQWDSSRDGKVTYEEWVDYFTDLSASVDEDDYWELMMRNAWHLEGGEGATANTSIPRHLVVGADGSQKVEIMAGSENFNYAKDGSRSYGGEL